MTRNSQTILVTGVNGFVGEHLTRELTDSGHDVIGAGLQQEVSPGVAARVKSYVQCDLLNDDHVDQLPWQSIDSVIHLAGLSAVGPSFDDPELYMKVNTGVLTGLFEGAIRAGSNRPRVIAVSSASLYTQSAEPIEEQAEISETSPYAKSKIEAEKILNSYRESGFPDSVNVRPFNHIGPGQGPGFLVPDLGLQIKDADKNAKIMVGNIKTKRDFTDVRDVARAYRILAEAETLDHELYNICSGNPLSGEEVLDMLKQALGRDDVTIEIDPEKIRPTDNMYVCGSANRLKADVGWSPEISIEKSLSDFAKGLY